MPIPAKRPFHPSATTEIMVSKLPSWMKIRQPHSKGFRYLDALAGNELEHIVRVLDSYSDYLNIVDSPVDAPTRTYEVELDYVLSSGVILASGVAGEDIEIKVIDDQTAFVTNPVTRLELAETFVPSGVISGIAGLELFNAFPTGFFVVQTGNTTIEPSSTLYYRWNTVDELFNPIPYSGDALGESFVGMAASGGNPSFDVLTPDPQWLNENNYEVGPWILDDGTQISSPPSGATLFESFINLDGEKIYRYKAFNNPFGSGVFNQADTELTFKPASSGDIKMYDILNLTSSGTPTEIPASGKAMYELISGTVEGTFKYLGYDKVIPSHAVDVNKFPDLVGATGTLAFVTSWDLLPGGGYVDDEVYPNSGTFDYIQGTGDFNTTVRFTNGVSRYQAEYRYVSTEAVGSLSSSPKTNSLSNPRFGTLKFLDSEPKFRAIPIEIAESNNFALRTDVKNVRPGASVNVTLKYDGQTTEGWENTAGNNKTIMFQNHNIGFSDEFGAL